MPRTYRQTGMTGNSVSYALSSDFTDTIKEILNRTQKKIGKYTLQNVVTDITLNRRRLVNQAHDEGGNPIPNDMCCDAPVYEFLKARLVLSGSVEGSAAMKLLIDDLKTIIDQLEDDYLNGFVTYGTTIVIP